MTSREYDVVLFGASGFVGKLTAQYLAEHAPEGTRIALAGRSESKIKAVADAIGKPDWPILIADSFDPDALAAIANSTTVVISTVGPYFRFGNILVNECARAGTHYVDLTGEVHFMKRSIEANNELAQQTGAKIVHACGFDSVPSDIGMLLLHEAVRDASVGSEKNADTQLKEATMIVKMKGGLSGGTIDSMRQQFAATKKDRDLARAVARPYTLSPDPTKEPDLGRQEDLGTKKLDEFGVKDGIAGPFIMASCNTRVVRRSNALLDYAYGDHLRYSEYMYMGKGFTGKKNNATMMGMLGMLAFSLSRPKTRKFFSRWLPEPGDGPSKDERENGFFSTTTYGTTESGKKFSATVALNADPGYKGTSLLLSEAALTLALGDSNGTSASDATGGATGDVAGVLTPATALGNAYIERLRKAGVKLEAGPVA